MCSQMKMDYGRKEWENPFPGLHTLRGLVATTCRHPADFFPFLPFDRHDFCFAKESPLSPSDILLWWPPGHKPNGFWKLGRDPLSKPHRHGMAHIFVAQSQSLLSQTVHGVRTEPCRVLWTCSELRMMPFQCNDFVSHHPLHFSSKNALHLSEKSND